MWKCNRDDALSWLCRWSWENLLGLASKHCEILRNVQIDVPDILRVDWYQIPVFRLEIKYLSKINDIIVVNSSTNLDMAYNGRKNVFYPRLWNKRKLVGVNNINISNSIHWML